MVEATIIIAAWNAADTVGRSVASARSQDGICAQTIVVDDASSDGTLAALDAHPDLFLERLAENGGPAAARNRGLDCATGNWVAVLDSDDTMAEGRLRRMIDLGEAEQADVVLGNFRKVTPEGQPVEQAPFLSAVASQDATRWDLERYLSGNQVSRRSRSLGYLKPVIRRAFLEENGIRYNRSLRNGEDCHLIFECLLAGARVLFDPQADYFYTVRPGSVSHRATPAHIDALIAADDALVALHGARLSQAERALFRSRRRNLSDMVETERVMHALRDGHVADGLSALRRQPRLARRVLRQLTESLRNRLGARLLPRRVPE